MENLWDQVQTFIWNVFSRPQLNDIVDILIVAYLIYQLILLTRETRASQVLKGLILLLLTSLISNLLGLNALNWLLSYIVKDFAVVLIVLFQPEIRRALGHLGSGAKKEHFQDDSEENQRIIGEITQCLQNLSRRRVGALIVFERRIGLKDVIETGTRIDSIISAPLLINIFEPNTPLHDGAAIIRGMRVMAAACVLTLSDSSAISRELGTRHRAAIGVSETTDAVVFIVSEETGIISLARGGKLTRHLDVPAIRQILLSMYHEPNPPIMEILRNLLKGRKRDAE